MATAAALQSDGLYSHLLLMSPFFGVSSDALDQPVTDVDKCLQTRGLSKCLFDVVASFTSMPGTTQNITNSKQIQSICDLVEWYIGPLDKVDVTFQTVQLLVRNAFEWATENWDAVPAVFQKALETPIGWGDECQAAVDHQNRGGFCNFRIRQLLAAHSIGQYAARLSATSSHKMSVFMAPVERDGRTRNGLVFQVLQALNRTGSPASACMWFTELGCTGAGNTCGVPHSQAAPADNLGLIPYTTYWNMTLYGGVTAFLASDDDAAYAADAPPNWNEPTWDLSRNQCVQLDVNEPPPSLVAPIPQIWKIAVAVKTAALRSAVEDAVVAGVARLTGIDKAALKLACRLLSLRGPAAADGKSAANNANKGQLLSSAAEARLKASADDTPVEGIVVLSIVLPEASSVLFRQVLLVAPAANVQNALGYPLVSADVGADTVTLPAAESAEKGGVSVGVVVLVAVATMVVTAFVTFKVSTREGARLENDEGLKEPLVERGSISS
jgi:hypothetical protein